MIDIPIDNVGKLHKMINASIFGWPSDVEVQEAHTLLCDIKNDYEAKLAAAEKLYISLWQAGYARGHDDTVESCFNPAWETEPDAAQEAIDAAKPDQQGEQYTPREE